MVLAHFTVQIVKNDEKVFHHAEVSACIEDLSLSSLTFTSFCFYFHFLCKVDGRYFNVTVIDTASIGLGYGIE